MPRTDNQPGRNRQVPANTTRLPYLVAPYSSILTLFNSAALVRPTSTFPNPLQIDQKALNRNSSQGVITNDSFHRDTHNPKAIPRNPIQQTKRQQQTKNFRRPARQKRRARRRNRRNRRECIHRHALVRDAPEDELARQLRDGHECPQERAVRGAEVDGGCVGGKV
jgi:hypothetical protein